MLNSGSQYILSLRTTTSEHDYGVVYAVTTNLDDGSPLDMFASPSRGYPPQELPYVGCPETQWATKISIFVPTDTVGPDKVGVRRNQMWYLDADGSQGWNVPGDDYFSFGISTDEPIVGDWDGDGYDEVGIHRGDMWYLDYDGNGQWNFLGDQYFRFGIVGDEPIVGDWDGDGTDEVGVHRGDAWYLDADGSGSWNVPGDEYFRFGISADEAIVGRWQSAGGGGGGGGQSGGAQASFACLSPVPATEPETALMLGLFSTNTSTAANATEIDSVFATEPAALPSALETDTELPMDGIAGQVTRSNRLGSGGLLDLPITNAHDQALQELLQSVWWL